jgi:hypothetical protein
MEQKCPNIIERSVQRVGERLAVICKGPHHQNIIISKLLLRVTETGQYAIFSFIYVVFDK